MMNNLLKRGFHLGIGAAVSGKERFGKMIQDMVDKGEMTPREAKELMDEWVRKGESLDRDWTNQSRAKMKDRMKELGFVPEEDYLELKARVERLEKFHEGKEEPPTPGV
ncbi:hypothetical protein U0355_02910 [Salimicrobium sp. PL1-032A]|uniref:phasin family protein n=1 Tax=Salimicrobium sp. PL1-032A TaxID=3095364 RepID=UPI0032610B7C